MYNKHKMYKGGPNYTAKRARVIRIAGLIIPIILISYGLLIEIGLIPSGRSIPIGGFLMLAFWWILVASIQFLYASRTRYDSAMRLIAYHLLATAYLFYVIGIPSPFAIFWIALIIASYVYFGRTGVYLSAIWFTLIVFADILFWAQFYPTFASYDLATLVAVLLSAIATIGIGTAHMRKTTAKTPTSETLQHDRMVTIINNLADAIISTDRHGVIRLYNAASLNLLDTNADINGRKVDDILPLVDQDGAKVSMLRELTEARSAHTRDDLEYSFADGEQIRLEITYSPIRSGNDAQEGFILIMRDVTKAKSLEEERDEFISVVSHELRTPITIMEGSLSNVQLMMKKGSKVTKATMTETVDAAHEQVVYLAKMVNDLSTLSRAERGIADAPELIDIRQLMHSMYDTYLKQAKAKKLHLNLDLSTTLGSVSASRLYLEELLQNFITNSIKYTQEGSITLSAEQKDGVVTFLVKDTGIGISKSDQQKIFQKFYRSEDYRTRETSGTGLGLYVAKKLSHKLGTNIEFTSRLNHGSTFWFKLPVIK